LREEYFPKPKLEEAAAGEDGDTKLEEKFEPFYEGETATEGHADSNTQSSSDAPTSEGTTTS